VPDDLVEAADPEQRLRLAADVAPRLVQPGGALEQRQLARVFFRGGGVLVDIEEARWRR
jgi:hypothetical protein